MLSEGDVQRIVDERLSSVSSLIRQLQGVATSNAQPAASTVGEGPSALSTDLVYTQINLDVDAGTWLVYAQATLTSQSGPDSKQIGLFNVTAGVDVPNSKGPVQEATAVNVADAFVTVAVVTLAVASRLRIKAFRNGVSQVSVGYPGALGDEQRMLAVRLF